MINEHINIHHHARLCHGLHRKSIREGERDSWGRAGVLLCRFWPLVSIPPPVKLSPPCLMSTLHTVASHYIFIGWGIGSQVLRGGDTGRPSESWWAQIKDRCPQDPTNVHAGGLQMCWAGGWAGGLSSAGREWALWRSGGWEVMQI